MRLPQLDAREIGKILNKLGFICMRQQGSHMFYAHADGRTTVVPNHPGEDIDRGLLNKIIKHDLQISREEFLRLMGKMK
jgi:predicted RNA binding protein YcfA (HicA-like mRNA interferase family)